MTEDLTMIIMGVCGSQAHGLAHADSDVDIHGVFGWPTPKFWSLDKPRESIVGTSPDFSYHELEKFLKLALNCNPQILEQLYLESYIEVEPYWGPQLIGSRGLFLSGPKVKSSYLGYAQSQFNKMREPGKTPEQEKRRRKHAKHLIRLLEQGYQLYTTGELTVRVADPAKYYDIAHNWSYEAIESYAHKLEDVLKNATTRLPDTPNRMAIEGYLRGYRESHVLPKWKK